MTRKLNIGGVPIEIVSDEEAENTDYLVCMRAV